jgi:hypothetical protein
MERPSTVRRSYSVELGSGLLRRRSVQGTKRTQALSALRLGLVLTWAWVARDAQTLAWHRCYSCGRRFAVPRAGCVEFTPLLVCGLGCGERLA